MNIFDRFKPKPPPTGEPQPSPNLINQNQPQPSLGTGAIVTVKATETDWFMWLMLIFLPPVGVFFMWKRRRFSDSIRMLVSIVAAIHFLIWSLIFLVGSTTPPRPTIGLADASAVASSSPARSSAPASSAKPSSVAPSSSQTPSSSSAPPEEVVASSEAPPAPAPSQAPLPSQAPAPAPSAAPAAPAAAAAPPAPTAPPAPASSQYVPPVEEHQDEVLPEPQGQQIYYTKSGEKYHYENPCGNGTYYPCTLKEALARGLTACEKCVLN